MQIDSSWRETTLLRSCVRVARLLAVGVATLALSGCYYLHLGSGQARLMFARNATEDLVADPETPETLRAKLRLVERARHFAADLGLEVGGRYTSYVDWPGDRVVTTVVATRPGEVVPRDFSFPLVGRVPYKGFFEEASARAEARALAADGLDVCLVPVAAYSTLGWLDDPLTAPMLRDGDDTRLVETVLHELVHATVFVASQPDFNEGAARFIGQEAAIRFFADDAGERARSAAVEARVRDDRRVAQLLLSFRADVETLYAEQDDPALRLGARSDLERRFRARLAREPFEARDPAVLAERARLNDACLALRGTYAADDARYARILESLGGDLPALIDRLRTAAEAEDPRSAFFELDASTTAGARRE